MKKYITNTLKFLYGLFARPDRNEKVIIEMHDLLLLESYERKKEKTNNPLAKKGAKCFSQADEDGITLEIIRRIGLESQGCFCEFGVGDGMENNTLILLAKGWLGAWVGNDTLKFDSTKKESRLFYKKTWVTRENIFELAQECLKKINRSHFDLISLDFDGNDLFMVEQLLENDLCPSIFIVEYNAHFPPPIKFSVAYDPTHVYNGDDYFGASLQSYCDLFQKHGYTLVCCNLMTGANAFFVKNELTDRFIDVPRNIDEIYTPPSFYLPRKFGYKHSPKTIESLICEKQ